MAKSKGATPVGGGQKKPGSRDSGRKLIASNKKARHEYHILETYEAGMVLTGTEVKSLRQGQASLVDGFAMVTDGEVWLHKVHIAEYLQGTWTNHAARRTRKLLLHRQEIAKLQSSLRESGFALVPMSLYFLDGRAKIEIGLARGKKTWDKRQDLAKRDAEREMQVEAGRRFKGRY